MAAGASDYLGRVRKKYIRATRSLAFNTLLFAFPTLVRILDVRVASFRDSLVKKRLFGIGIEFELAGNPDSTYLIIKTEIKEYWENKLILIYICLFSLNLQLHSSSFNLKK